MLKDDNFEIEAGKTLALVGETGAGKTSVTNVLNRFYDIQKGEICVDDKSIANVKLSSLFGGVVVQFLLVMRLLLEN